MQGENLAFFYLICYNKSKEFDKKMNFKNLVYQSLIVDGVLITNIPSKKRNGIPNITATAVEKIEFLVMKAHSLGAKEIDFSYKLH